MIGLTFIGFAACSSGSQGGNNDSMINPDMSQDGNHDLAAVADMKKPPGVLIFFGHSGIAPPGVSGYIVYEKLKTQYEAAGLNVDYVGIWPASLSNYRLAIFVIPGQGDRTDFFTTNEVTSIRNFVSQGGTLFVQNDYSIYAGTPVLNDLFTRLGVGVSYEDANIGSGGSYGVLTNELASDPLLQGFGKLGFGNAARVLPGSKGTSLVRYMNDCVMAAEAIGAGRVVASGDSNFIDDHALTEYPPDGGENIHFANRLAALPN